MNEKVFLLGPLFARAFQRYWRLARGLNLAVEAYVIDEAGSVLTVCESAGGARRLPKGPVRKGETLEFALRRLLREFAGIEVNAKPELSLFYSEGKDRQTGIYLVRHWRRLPAPASRQIEFIKPGSLPVGVAPEAAERIRRSLEGRTISEV